jgi:hypothetical protein
LVGGVGQVAGELDCGQVGVERVLERAAVLLGDQVEAQAVYRATAVDATEPVGVVLPCGARWRLGRVRRRRRRPRGACQPRG